MKDYYKKENLEKIVKKCLSYSEVLREIGLADKGSNFNTLKKYIEKYDLDTTHFLAQTWNKGKTGSEKTSNIKLNDILKDNINFKSSILKMRLIKEGLKEYRCEICGCDGKWMDKPITLELHHVNGNHYDNRLENLQILCPNCHSQTPTHKKGKKIYENRPLPFERKKYVCICEICGKEFKSDRERRFCSRECYNISLKKGKKITEITKELLEEAFKTQHTLTDLAKYFNTSRTTIRKHLENYNLLEFFKNEYGTESLHYKEVIQLDINNNIIKEWGSIRDAEETLKIYGITKVLHGKRKSAGGFIWKYKKNHN